MRHWIGYVVMLVACTGCELPEKPYAPPVGLSVEAAMGPDYANVVYFDFDMDTALLVRSRDVYDLQWSPEDDAGFRLNSSGFGQFKRSESYDFHAELDTAEFPGTWQWSHEGAELFAEDLGSWTVWDSSGLSPVFAIDPGVDVSNQGRSMVRVQFEIDPNGVLVYWAPWSLTTSCDTLRMEAIEGVQFMHFDNGVVEPTEVEPEYWDWSIGQYVDQDTMSTTGEILPYVVRGVLIPESHAAKKTRRQWGQMYEEWAYAQVLEQRTNIIGFDWKYYSFTSSSYEVDTTISYLVERPDGIRYGLRFLGYYNDQGLKGHAQSQWKVIVE